jgi:hypothetical protein
VEVQLRRFRQRMGVEVHRLPRHALGRISEPEFGPIRFVEAFHGPRHVAS